MLLSFYNLKRYVAGIAFTWVLLLVLMHEKLLKQNHETEKAKAEIMSGNMLQIQCGNEITVLKDRICVKRFKWVIVNWIKDKCFGEYGVTSSKDIDCSVYQYLVFVERICPFPEDAATFFESVVTSPKIVQDFLPKAEVASDFNVLLEQLNVCGKVCDWIKSRVNSTAQRWIIATQNFINDVHLSNNSSENFQDKPVDKVEHEIRSTTTKLSKVRLKVLLHMGLLTREYGLNFGEAALKGGSLKELLQWADLMSALHALGHDVILSWSPSTLQDVVFPNKYNVQRCQPARTVDLVFTDITGLEQLRLVLGSLYNYRCLIRVLDVFGTDPEFNHPYFNPDRDKTRSWGGKGLNPAQFLTQFPNSPDNSFLGFVVENYEGDIKTLKSGNTALLYGKRAAAASGKGKRNFLDKIHEFYGDTHATMWSRVDDDSEIPPYVINHKNVEQQKFLELLRKSSLFVGLGLPYEGPAALEAIANGAIFINPRFVSFQNVDDEKPTNRKLTSQNPYAEHIGEPYVYTVNIQDLYEVEDVLKRIKQTKIPKLFLPHEFSFQGFLERIDSYVTNQDFCEEQIRTQVGTPVIWKHTKRRWPPTSALQIEISEFGESCTSTCSRHKMVCERSFFSEINTFKAFRLLAIKCNDNRKIFPRVDYEEFRIRRKNYEKFSIPCNAPSFNLTAKECNIQTDELLFSCACTPPNDIKRLCSCRRHKPITFTKN